MEEGGVLPQGNTGYTRGVSGTHLETNSTLVQKFNLDHFDLTEIVQYCHKSGLEERMARSVEGAARIRSTRGRSIISSGGTSCSGSSISGKNCSSGGVSSSGSINGSIEGTGGGSCGSGSSGGSCGDVEGGGRGGGNGVRRDDIISGGDGGGMEEIGRGKIAGDGSGSRVCTSRLLLTGWASGAARHL